MGKWGNIEIEELRSFYKENNVPSDQLVKDKTALDDFTSRFTNIIVSGQSFTSKEVADQLFKLRKSGRLPRIRK